MRTRKSSPSVGACLPTLEQEAHERLMQVRDGGLGSALGDVAEPTVLGCALELNDAAHQLGGADELAGPVQSRASAVVVVAAFGPPPANSR